MNRKLRIKDFIIKPKKKKAYLSKIDKLFKYGQLSELDKMIILYYLPEFKLKKDLF